MFKNSFKIIILLTIMILSGCGHKQIVVQKRDVGYLKFDKSMFNGYIVTINDKYTFKLGECKTDKKAYIRGRKIDTCKSFTTSNTLYEVKSGANFLEIVTDKNEIIMQKEIYIGSNNTVEVHL